jgi:hypothetical protein
MHILYNGTARGRMMRLLCKTNKPEKAFCMDVCKKDGGHHDLYRNDRISRGILFGFDVAGKTALRYNTR